MTEPHRSEPDFVVLHTLRCIGFAGEARIASASGMHAGDAAGRLRALSEAGLVDHLPGPFGGWGLTDQGRTRDQELLAAELEVTDSRDHVRRSYESFLTLNPAVLDICHDWQMSSLGRTQILNDHSDRNHDSEVLSRLIRIDAAAQEICADLAGRLMRFAIYGKRLSTALERSLAGDNAYVTDSLDSYHNVWFQLHENLLATLGISRDDERNDARGVG